MLGTLRADWELKRSTPQPIPTVSFTRIYTWDINDVLDTINSRMGLGFDVLFVGSASTDYDTSMPLSVVVTDFYLRIDDTATYGTLNGDVTLKWVVNGTTVSTLQMVCMAGDTLKHVSGSLTLDQNDLVELIAVFGTATELPMLEATLKLTVTEAA